MSNLIEKGGPELRLWVEDDVLEAYIAEGWSLVGSVAGSSLDHYLINDGSIVPDLDAYRAERWEAVKALRDTKENGVAPTPFGEVQCDDRSKVKVNGLVQMALLAISAGTTFSEPFTRADNSVITLDANMTLQLGVSIGQFISDVYARGRELRAEIDSASTLDALNAIDIDAGWPTA